MSNAVHNYGYNYQTKVYDTKSTATSSTAAEAAAKETSAEETAQKQDTFEKSTQYKPDMKAVSAMKSDLGNNVAAFKKMVQGMFKSQGGAANNAMNALLNIDKNTQAEAQQAISEDGEWGVEKTAMRILDFAKAISGGDPAKIETLKKAVNDGFAAASKVWGGTLPDISHQTLERVMQGFDEWANESKTETV